MYLGDGIFAGTIDDIVEWPLASDVIDAHKLKEAGVYETHAHTVPHVHGSQI